MRVTTKTMTDTMTRYLTMHNKQLYKVQEQIASQKKINRPSDDPSGMRRILGYRNRIATIDQYLDNIARAKSRLEISELTLDMVDDSLGVVREIAWTQAKGTTDSRNFVAQQVRDLSDQLRGLANTTFGNNYMFSGHQTDTPPYDHIVEISAATPGTLDFGLATDAANVTIRIQDKDGNVVRTIAPADVGPGSDGINSVVWDGLDDGGAPIADGHYRFTVEALDAANNSVPDYPLYNGDDGELKIILGEGTQLAFDADGRNIFSPLNPDGSPAGINVFEVLADLVHALENDDGSAIDAQIRLLDIARVQINEIRGANAPKMYQLENTEEFWANYKPKLQQLLSDTENVDLNEAAMKLQTIELAYQTTIATAARIIQPGLIDFLK